MSGFKEDVSPMKDLSPVGLMLGIFENNALKTFLVMVLGLAFGIVPAIFTLANGLILGIVTGATASKYGLFYVAVGTLPHGIVELPMVLISAAIGMKLGTDLLLAIFRRKVNMFRRAERRAAHLLLLDIPVALFGSYPGDLRYGASAILLVHGPLTDKFILLCAHGILNF